MRTTGAVGDATVRRACVHHHVTRYSIPPRPVLVRYSPTVPSLAGFPDRAHTVLMTVKVLGPLDTGTEHTLSPRERVVLSALIVLAGRTVSTGELAEAYWGADLPRTWTQQLKTS